MKRKYVKQKIVLGLIEAAERRLIPDKVIRLAIRYLCGLRLKSLPRDPAEKASQFEAFLTNCRLSQVAVSTEEANLQHYEVPASFFELFLGPRQKYSCCYWENDQASLAEAEELALAQSCERSGLKDGHKILELGCGWGSMSLYLAQHYPSSQILAISNSNSQKLAIEAKAKLLGFSNLKVETHDINNFETDEKFDRVISIEMFEHVRNHHQLLGRISRWMLPEGKLFIHVFCGAGNPYFYEDNGPEDWMTRNFFQGGMMPSNELFWRYQDDLKLEKHWSWSGCHYQKTLERWLVNLDERHPDALTLLRDHHTHDPGRQIQKWRMFLMACSELFGYHQGQQWWVSHYLFSHSASSEKRIDLGGRRGR